MMGYLIFGRDWCIDTDPYLGFGKKKWDLMRIIDEFSPSQFDADV